MFEESQEHNNGSIYVYKANHKKYRSFKINFKVLI